MGEGLGEGDRILKNGDVLPLGLLGGFLGNPSPAIAFLRAGFQQGAIAQHRHNTDYAKFGCLPHYVVKAGAFGQSHYQRDSNWQFGVSLHRLDNFCLKLIF